MLHFTAPPGTILHFTLFSLEVVKPSGGERWWAPDQHPMCPCGCSPRIDQVRSLAASAQAQFRSHSTMLHFFTALYCTKLHFYNNFWEDELLVSVSVCTLEVLGGTVDVKDLPAALHFSQFSSRLIFCCTLLHFAALYCTMLHFCKIPREQIILDFESTNLMAKSGRSAVVNHIVKNFAQNLHNLHFAALCCTF